MQVGSPLTHQRYLNRHKGTYGPAISAATSSFPGCKTPLAGLYRCTLLCSAVFCMQGRKLQVVVMVGRQ